MNRLSTVLSLLATVTLATGNTVCPPAHLLLARGTTESYPGILGSLTNLTLKSIPGSTYENIIYPAGNTPSYEQGIANGTAQLKAFVGRCPASKIGLLGFSQGAMVVSDMLAGGGDNGLLGNVTDPTVHPETLGCHVNAVALYGDPRHTSNQTYNVGAAGATGSFPRTSSQINELNKYAGRMRDYCNERDGVCDASGSNTTAHWASASTWDAVAADWLKSVLE